MNNYQLDNTSVYLGGQCKWDMVVERAGDGVLKVSGFQLTPLSNNVPFNYQSDITRINTSHSENIRRLYSSVKDNFWWTSPNNVNPGGGWDYSCFRGPRRLKSYGIYEKQFGYLQPLWLEHIDNDSHLEFVFDICIDGGSGSPIDTITLSLENNNIGDFHDRFVNYLNAWLDYVNVRGDKGNNKVLNISLDDYTATIDGVNISTGQRSGEINVDYLVTNLLSQERPLMEGDYILSTLFKDHNIITSQLFNFNFCFNIKDILDPSLIYIIGKNRLKINCSAKIVGPSSTNLPLMRLHTNYEFIDKDVSNPYIILDSIEANGYSIDQIKPVEWISSDPDKEYKNVLDYLCDNTDPTLSTKNKLTQPIIHWGYCEGDNTFNAYEGYNEIYNEISEIDVQEDSVKVTIKEYPIKSTNGVNILDFPINYIDGSNNYTWILPKQAIYIRQDIDRDSLVNINRFFTLYMETYGLTIDDCADFWGVKDVNYESNLKDKKVMLIIVQSEELLSTLRTYIPFISTFIVPNAYICGKTSNNDYVIISQESTLQSIIAGLETTISMKDLCELLKVIKHIITDGNNGHYIKFDKELGVSRDDTGGQAYYKVDTVDTFPYRKDGNLRPFFVEHDDNKYENYVYGLDKDGSIIRIESNPNNVYEWLWIGGDNLIAYTPAVVNFEWIKTPNTEETLVDHLKELFKSYYGEDNADYIFNLYNYDFTYNYSGDNYENITYTGKLTLK